jgi:hypothetical protein
MTTPYNLSREVNHGSNKANNNTPATQRGLSTSHSSNIKQTRNLNSSGSQNYLETNFMSHFGTSAEHFVNMRD